MSDEPQKRSPSSIGRTAVTDVAHKFLRLLFGLPSLAFGFALLSFAIGLGLTDAALDAFCPQCNNVGWIRLAGGVSALSGYIAAIKWRSRWSWPQILAAISLFPVLALLWGFGITWILDPSPNPIRSLCLGLPLAIALGGAAGILGGRFWPGRKHRE
jgi:hypothetical protein